jgi:hypothetical protein
MSMMAQRLFHRGDRRRPARPTMRRATITTPRSIWRHSADPALAVAELEWAARRGEPGELATSPGSGHQVLRGLPDTGPSCGAADAGGARARMFAQGATGRIAFRRDEVETVVYTGPAGPVRVVERA